MIRRKKKESEPKVVDLELVAKALAKAIFAGDIVNFRLLFSAFSPARTETPEILDSDKYRYLLPDDGEESEGLFEEALGAVKAPANWDHILGELVANRPAQLPSPLLLLLSDNAIRRAKYTSAAQALELMRTRRRTREEFFKVCDAALDKKDIKRAVIACLIGASLAYDYAAFPEPLPEVADFQTKALMIHGQYPLRVEDCVGLRSDEELVPTAIEYLLNDGEASARLADRPLDVRLDFVRQWILTTDPGWDSFTKRFKKAGAMTQAHGERLRQSASHAEDGVLSLEQEIEEQMAEDARAITSELLGRTISGGQWWQYLKEIAFEHPAAILFLSRQAIGDGEILVPRCRADSKLVQALNLASDIPEVSPSEQAAVP